MIETSGLHYRETIEVLNPVQSYHNEQDADSQHDPGRKRWIGQVLRFGLVGGLNTIVDLLILNMLLLLFPTSSTRMILIYSAIAYSLGAVNSFLLNKYWTFGYCQRTTWREVARFIVTTLCGIGWSSIILWLASNALHPLLVNTTIWANASKVIAISGTALISYLGMSLWVFVNKARKEQTRLNAPVPAWGDAGTYPSCHSISVVLPAYNEEQVIANAVFTVLHVLNAWHLDFEVLVVNDGSTDRTGEIVAALAGAHSR